MPVAVPPLVFVRYAITANGNWRCPIDVTAILATGYGGGGSGGGGSTTGGGGGGGGTIQSTISIAVTPETLYAIVIGAGGTGSAATVAGNVGADTTFNAGGGVGLSGTWSGASGGLVGSSVATGGQCFKATGNTSAHTARTPGSVSPAAGGYDNGGATAGCRNPIGGFAGGTAGATVTQPGGGGGGAGPEGAGTAGATGSAGTGGTSSSAGANTGAGSGGGGGGSTAGGPSGAGGSGKLYLEYWTSYPTVVTS